MKWRHALEILCHHCQAGRVWDGDQICKQSRTELMAQGYLRRDPCDGAYTIPTKAGQRTWARWGVIYIYWTAALRLKWRVSELLH